LNKKNFKRGNFYYTNSGKKLKGMRGGGGKDIQLGWKITVYSDTPLLYV
jgi:hypothetical protein